MWHYQDKNGQWQGSINGVQLRILVNNGMVTRKTPMREANGNVVPAERIYEFPPKEWYYRDKRDQWQGPFDKTEVQSLADERIIRPDTFMRKQNGQQGQAKQLAWIKLRKKKYVDANALGISFYDVLRNKYLLMNGRARRLEYWWFFLLFICLPLLAYVCSAFCYAILDDTGGLGGAANFVWLFPLLLLVLLIPPLICLQVRRLHDIGWSDWVWYVNLIPQVGGLVFFIFMCLGSQRGDNQYGPNPKDGNESKIRIPSRYELLVAVSTLVLMAGLFYYSTVLKPAWEVARQEIKRIEENKAKQAAQDEIKKKAEEKRRKEKEEFDHSRVDSDTIDKMKNSYWGDEFKQDCDFLSQSLSWSPQDLLTVLNGKTAQEVHTYRLEKEAFLKLTVSRENIDKMLMDDQFKKDWDYLSGNGLENEELKKKCENLTDTAEKSKFLNELAQLSKGKTTDELLSELNGNNFAEVHRYKEKFAGNLAEKYANIGGKIDTALKDQRIKEEHDRLIAEWQQKKLPELKKKAAWAKPRAVWFEDEIKEKMGSSGYSWDLKNYINYGTKNFYDAYQRANRLERDEMKEKLQIPPLEAKKKIFKHSHQFDFGGLRPDGNGTASCEVYVGGNSSYNYAHHINFTFQDALSGEGKHRSITITLKQYSVQLMNQFDKNKENYRVVIVFDNLHIESGNYSDTVCADLISADIVEKGTESPVVNLYPETKLVPRGGGRQGTQPEPGTVNDKAQQIKNIVNGFLAMEPNENVLIPLTSFRDNIIWQIEAGITQRNDVITVRNKGFLPRGNDEVFVVDAFLKASKEQQFETIWRTACGKAAVQDTDRQTPKQKQIVGACKAFSMRIAAKDKEKQPPAAPENNGGGVVPQEPSKQ